jgi:hypothetical protein
MIINERGRALALAVRLTDRPDTDPPDDDLILLARQLIRAHEEIERLRATQRDPRHE